ncbi:unnamed protein product [Ixodes pacificus]
MPHSRWPRGRKKTHETCRTPRFLSCGDRGPHCLLFPSSGFSIAEMKCLLGIEYSCRAISYCSCFIVRVYESVHRPSPPCFCTIRIAHPSHSREVKFMQSFRPVVPVPLSSLDAQDFGHVVR